MENSTTPRASARSSDVRRSAGPSQAEWARYRSRITELYQAHKLQVVMNKMAAQGFHATVRTYRKHISEWGLDKNHKAHEMRAIAVKAHQQSLRNQRAAFFVRGREVTQAELCRYFKRRKIAIDDIIAQRSTAKTPPSVQCVLLPSSPVDRSLAPDALPAIDTSNNMNTSGPAEPRPMPILATNAAQAMPLDLEPGSETSIPAHDTIFPDKSALDSIDAFPIVESSFADPSLNNSALMEGAKFPPQATFPSTSGLDLFELKHSEYNPRFIPSIPSRSPSQQAAQWIRIYIQSSFGTGTWCSASEGEFAFSRKAVGRVTSVMLTGHMDRLHNQVQTACFLLNTFRYQEGHESLLAAKKGISDIVETEYPPLLDRLPRTLLTVITNYQMPLVARAILRQIEIFACRFHGRNHPLYQFCHLLISMDDANLDDAICAMVFTVREGFTAALGPFHRTTLAASYTYVRTVLARPGPATEAQGFREVVQRCQKQLPSGDMRTVKARTDLVLFLQRTKQFEEGRIEARNIIAETWDMATCGLHEKRSVMLCARGHSCLAGCEYGLGRIEEAILHRRIAIELYKSLGDEERAHVADELFWVGEWLAELGNLEDSNQARLEMELYNNAH